MIVLYVYCGIYLLWHVSVVDWAWFYMFVVDTFYVQGFFFFDLYLDQFEYVINSIQFNSILGSISFHSLFFKPILDCKYVGFAVCVMQWLGHCLWLVLQYRRQRLLLYVLMRMAGLHYITGIIIALGHCLEVRLHWLRRVLCTQSQPLQGNVCYANRILR
jgi:hypothetical protein